MAATAEDLREYLEEDQFCFGGIEIPVEATDDDGADSACSIPPAEHFANLISQLDEQELLAYQQQLSAQLLAYQQQLTPAEFAAAAAAGLVSTISPVSAAGSGASGGGVREDHVGDFRKHDHHGVAGVGGLESAAPDLPPLADRQPQQVKVYDETSLEMFDFEELFPIISDDDDNNNNPLELPPAEPPTRPSPETTIKQAGQSITLRPTHFRTSDYDKFLLFLDYDGTLREFEDDPVAAVPSDTLNCLLTTLCSLREILKVIVISGRDSEFLDNYMGKQHLALTLVAEHGYQVRHAYENEWKITAETWSSAQRQLQGGAGLLSGFKASSAVQSEHLQAQHLLTGLPLPATGPLAAGNVGMAGLDLANRGGGGTSSSHHGPSCGGTIGGMMDHGAEAVQLPHQLTASALEHQASFFLSTSSHQQQHERNAIFHQQEKEDFQHKQRNWRQIVLTEMRKLSHVAGSFVEEKKKSLVWHYRACRGDDGVEGEQTLLSLLEFSASYPMERVSRGNKMIEVFGPQSPTKGVCMADLILWWDQMIHRFRSEEAFCASKNCRTLVFCAGDDVTDETMFELERDENLFGVGNRTDLLSVKVGSARSCAKYRVDSPKDLRMVLQALLLSFLPNMRIQETPGDSHNVRTLHTDQTQAGAMGNININLLPDHHIMSRVPPKDHADTWHAATSTKSLKPGIDALFASATPSKK